MHTLEQLRSGELHGIKELKISQELTTFPLEILKLADSLEILDLSHNKLTTIPIEINKLKKLKIAFFSYNEFTSVPAVFKECNNLYMLGLKGNKMEGFSEDILPLSISWLILTDNRLKKLPDSIGKLTKLQKFPLAGNLLEELPDAMSQCINLELIRLSANRLREIPSWLLTLPKLSWLAFSGNPCSISKEGKSCEVDFEKLEVGKLLGEGASGEIYKAYSQELDSHGALKLFKGAITSDGYAEDEINAYTALSDHPNLIKVLARVKSEEKLGLLLEFIPSRFVNLGNPPNFDTCTRDTFENDRYLKIDAVVKIAKAIASSAEHLHNSSLMHGDLYSHNILVDQQSNSYLGDFGAASFYDENESNYERLEVRAFGCLLEDLLSLCGDSDSKAYKSMEALSLECMSEDVSSRPLFREMRF